MKKIRFTLPRESRADYHRATLVLGTYTENYRLKFQEDVLRPVPFEWNLLLSSSIVK